MAKFWKDQRYNESWEPIDDQGNVTGGHDWQADREYAETQPGGAWNFSPTVMAANPVKSDTTRPTYGTPDKPLPAPGSGAAGAAPYGTPPNGANPAGTPTNYQVPTYNPNEQPAWMNWQPPGQDYNAQAMGQILGADPFAGTDLAGTGGIKSPRGGGDPYAPVIGADGRTIQSGNGRGQFAAAQTAGGGGTAWTGGGGSHQEGGGGFYDDAGNLVGGGTPPNTAPGINPPRGNLEQSLYSSVTNQINAPTTVDRNDPAYQQQTNAFNANSQRSADRQRAVAAQRAHAGGTLASGGFDGRVNRLTQDQGLNEQAFEAQLMDSLGKQNIERQSRAQQLGAGLVGQDKQLGQQESQFGRSLGQQDRQFNTGQRNNLWTSNQRNQLARELGLGDLGVRHQGLGLQRELGLGDLDYRRDALGQNSAFQQANLNQNALLALLNGF